MTPSITRPIPMAWYTPDWPGVLEREYRLSEEDSLLPKDVGSVAESLWKSLHHLLQLPVPQEDVSHEE